MLDKSKKKLCFPLQKKKELEKRTLPYHQTFPVLQQDFISNRTFRLKKNIYFICHLGGISTCFGCWAIPVSVQGSFQQFLLKLVQTGFSLSSIWLNLQPNKYFCFYHQDFFYNVFVLPLIWSCLLRWNWHRGKEA